VRMPTPRSMIAVNGLELSRPPGPERAVHAPAMHASPEAGERSNGTVDERHPDLCGASAMSMAVIFGKRHVDPRDLHLQIDRLNSHASRANCHGPRITSIMSFFRDDAVRASADPEAIASSRIRRSVLTA
jgi:hypothetical protein